MFTPLLQIPDLEMFSVGTGRDKIKNLEGPIRLDCWRGFQRRREFSNSQGLAQLSDGGARITIGGDMPDPEPTVRTFHVNAYNFLMAEQQDIQQVILQTLLYEYRNLQQMYCFTDKEAAALMPDVHHVDHFRKLIGLSAVHLLNISVDDIAYVGYEFGCTWDAEYGLGVMTHKSRVIEIGDASTAFLTEIADRDCNPPGIEGEPTELPDFTIIPKPWWKFW